ncbi:MAG: hypothetical protein II820_06310 [Ruminiclostridium sp.]|nr:hypothetical protein [Ruminiclostridium sp.]
MNFRKISKKIFIARIIISIILLIVVLIIGIWLWINSLTQHHFNNDKAPEYMICDLTGEEQSEVLDAFGLTIPENEEKAYVYSFSYGAVDERLYGYTVEIAGVEDYEAFYSANPEHRSFNETTRSRTDRSYYIVYTGSVDTLMKKQEHDKYFAVYNKINEGHQ